MRNSVIAFLASALVGAVLSSATPSSAATKGYWRRIHAHNCRTIGGADLKANRLMASYGRVVASCPLGESTGIELTTASPDIKVTAFFDNPNPADPVILQVCGTNSYQDNKCCSKAVSSPTTLAAGYGEVAVSGPFPSNYYGAYYATAYVTLPTYVIRPFPQPVGFAALNGLELLWL